MAGLGAFSFIARALDFKSPLSECGVTVGLKLLSSEQRGFQSSGSDRFQKSGCNRLIDTESADVRQ